MIIGKRLIIMARTSKQRPEIVDILAQPSASIQSITPDSDEPLETEVTYVDNIDRILVPKGPVETVADNIEAAMHKVAETLGTTRKSNIGSTPGEPAQRQVLIRASVRDHDRWKQCAEIKGMALSELIRELCNNLAVEMLECSHPPQFRRTYKWSDTCTKCNTRLR
jgi:hypothetical protein